MLDLALSFAYNQYTRSIPFVYNRILEAYFAYNQYTRSILFVYYHYIRSILYVYIYIYIRSLEAYCSYTKHGNEVAHYPIM